ncbi:MAG: glycosyltransferase [Candidatus Nanopelagicales bacterium]
MAARTIVIAVTTPMAVDLLLLPQLPALGEAGWRIHLVCSHGPVSAAVRPLVAGLHAIPLARAVSPVRDLASVARMRRLLLTIRPDVVLGSTPKAAMVSMIAARLARVPVRVFQVRGARWEGEAGLARRLLVWADRRTAASATDVIAVSASLAELVRAEGIVSTVPRVLGRGGSKGVDLALFLPDPSHAFRPDRPRLGFAGRLSSDKGIDQLIEVVAAVRRAVPGATCEVVGDVDPAQPSSARALAVLREDPAFSWAGAVPQAELARAMRAWDLLVFPSAREGLPNVVIEAAACGVPSVAWDVTGVRDAVDDARTGRLVPFGDIGGMARAALESLAEPAHASLRAAAVDWAASGFDSRSLGSALVAYLDEACQRAAGESI